MFALLNAEEIQSFPQDLTELRVFLHGELRRDTTGVGIYNIKFSVPVDKGS